MSTVWHSKYALSANVIHSLIKPPQKEDIFSATCCELSAQTCRNAAVAAAAASSPQKRQEGAAGREMASTGIIYFADEYLKRQPTGASRSPLFSVAGSRSREPASCQGPRFAGKIYLPCWWEPTSPSQAVQTNVSESKTRGTLLPNPQNSDKRKQFVLPSLPAHKGSHCGSCRKAKEGKQTVPRTLFLWVPQKGQKPQGTEQIRYKCHNFFF